MALTHRAFPMLLQIAIAAPIVAHAQGLAIYDGTYNGVSMTASGGGRSCAPSRSAPLTLTIKNGAVQWTGGMTGNVAFQGIVSAQGAVSGRGSNGVVFTGKIEGGRLTGGSNGGGSCTITSVWQKQ